MTYIGSFGIAAIETIYPPASRRIQTFFLKGKKPKPTLYLCQHR